MAERFNKSDAIPNCPPQVCDSLQSEIQQLCHRMDWPPRQPVVVIDPNTGQACYCMCR